MIETEQEAIDRREGGRGRERERRRGTWVFADDFSQEVNYMTMASISKHPRSLKKSNIEKGKDRISSLPDSILVHILSFLPTKFAVATSILSARWKHIWASVPILDFNHLLVAEPKLWNDDVYGFMNFVDRVLMFHDLSCIHAFRLRCGVESDYARVNAWIGVAIKRQVQELDFLAFTEVPISLPRILFTCKTLVVLKLGTEFQLVNFPVSIHLPSLKTLHLSVASPNNDLMQNLLSGCPVVEDFYFYGLVGGPEGSVLNISNPALKNHCLSRYVLKGLSSLVKADIDVGMGCFSDSLHANPVFLILKEISIVKFLSLGSFTMNVLHFADDNTWPVFPNLTHLELDVHKRYGWRRLLDLLNSAPSLAVLELKFLYTETFSGEFIGEFITREGGICSVKTEGEGVSIYPRRPIPTTDGERGDRSERGGEEPGYLLTTSRRK
ncbi:hypothetical protein F0562_022395 [Nyssa sinensis]|uniref:Uncharacterized protein n=1 Tax=Nyssa sinensis TaxID=561372 RepID=A0A5J5BMN3_9ASTE|nr:hypothetical protein F0562_022395 [Nyssa sinensis]